MRSVVLLCATLSLTLSLSASREVVSWSYVERDVWIDQSLSRPVLVYRASDTTRYLVLSERLPRALVLDPRLGQVYALPKNQISLERDRSRATSGPIDSKRPVGRAAVTEDGILHASAAGRGILLAPHQSPSGEIAVEWLLAHYPAWSAGVGCYEPDPGSIDTLRSVTEATELTVVFATWCGDSRREVPRLLKTVELADNPNLHVRLIGIDSEFHEPSDRIQELRIINVPTILVERDGKEIGRIVETPATESIEQDLASIVAGNPPVHPGRWSREGRIAHGRYEIAFSDGSGGSETWEIFATATGGRLAHSSIETGRLTREVWHRFDEKGRSEFVEITDRTSEGIRRTRLRAGDDRLLVTSRGDRSGVIEQVVRVGPNRVISTGSILSCGWECLPMMADRGDGEIPRYAVPLEPCASVGCLETIRLLRGESREIDAVRGRRAVDVMELATQEETRRVWIDGEHGIPLRIETPELQGELVEWNL